MVELESFEELLVDGLCVDDKVDCWLMLEVLGLRVDVLGLAVDVEALLVPITDEAE